MQSLLLFLMMAFPGASHEFWDLLQAKQFDRAKALLDKGSYVDSKQAESSAIHFAAQAGDLEAVKFLIAHGSDVDDPDGQERTPLMTAASRGDLAMVEFLVDQGASLEAVSEHNRTPLMHALLHRRDSVVDVLLKKHSGHLFEPDRDGGYPKMAEVLFLSLAVGNSAAVEWLFAVHPDPNLRLRGGKTLLMAAADGNATRFVQRLLSLHADHSALDKEGNTALHHACMGGADTSLLKLLLRNGANPNARNAEQQTPLHLVVASENAANVRVLLREKIDLELPDLSGKTPFGKAMEKGLEEIALLLKDKGAKMVLPTKRSYDSNIVVETNSPLFAKLVIASGVDVNGEVYPHNYSGSNRYERILTIAASQGWNEVIELALAKGADPNLTNAEHMSPLECALDHRQFGAFQLLVQRGAKVDTGMLGRYLRYVVVLHDSLNGISALLNHGANINARDPYGQTPLMIATSCRQVGNVRVLLQSNADPNLRDEGGEIRAPCGDRKWLHRVRPVAGRERCVRERSLLERPVLVRFGGFSLRHPPGLLASGQGSAGFPDRK
jgi:ankyrin repeat protein